MVGIEAVIFDLDDTLIYSGIDYRRMKLSLIGFLVRAGVEPRLLNERMSNLEIFKVAAEYFRGKSLAEDEIKRVFEEANTILDRAEMESISGARLMDGAIETLRALRERGLKVGIITNGCRKYATEIIKRFSLDKYIDVLVARDDVPNQKPSPDHLLEALNALSVLAEEAVFVGDHWIDVLCAKNAGVKFILFRSKKGYIEEAENIATAIIDDLRDIIRLILK